MNRLIVPALASFFASVSVSDHALAGLNVSQSNAGPSVRGLVSAQCLKCRTPVVRQVTPWALHKSNVS